MTKVQFSSYKFGTLDDPLYLVYHFQSNFFCEYMNCSLSGCWCVDVNLMIGNAGNTVFFPLNDFTKPNYHCHNLATVFYFLIKNSFVWNCSCFGCISNTIITARYLNLIHTTMSLGKVSDITEKSSLGSIFTFLSIFAFTNIFTILIILNSFWMNLLFSYFQIAQKCAVRHNKFSMRFHPSNGWDHQNITKL